MSISFLWQLLWCKHFEYPLSSLENHLRQLISNQYWPSPLTLCLHRLWCMEALLRVLTLPTWPWDGNLPYWHNKSCDNSHADIQLAQSTHYLISWKRGSHPSFFDNVPKGVPILLIQIVYLSNRLWQLNSKIMSLLEVLIVSLLDEVYYS